MFPLRRFVIKHFKKVLILNRRMGYEREADHINPSSQELSTTQLDPQRLRRYLQ